MNIEITNTTEKRVVNRIFSVEGESDVTMTRNELNQNIECAWNRVNTDGTTSIYLRYDLNSNSFTADSLSYPKSVADYELYEALKAQLLIFNAEYNGTTEE